MHRLLERSLVRSGLVALLSVAISASAVGESCKVTVGLVLPLTGNALSYGERAQRGALIARELVRDVCDVSLEFADSKWESAPGVTAYRLLVQRSKIDAIVTASSQVSIPIREMAARDGITQFAIFTATDAYSKPNSSSFRVCSRASDEVVPLVDVVAREPSPVVGALFLANDFGEAVTQEFSKQLVSRGLRLSISERILPTASDLRSEILRLKHAGVTHLLAVGLPFQYVSIFRVSRELKFEPQFLSLRNIEDAALTRVGIEQGRVVYSYSFDAQADNSHTQEFVRAFRERYQGVTPDAYAAEGFEAVRMAAIAAASCKQDLACKLRTLRSQPFATLFGDIRFDESGNTMHSLFLKTIAGDSFVRVTNQAPLSPQGGVLPGFHK